MMKKFTFRMLTLSMMMFLGVFAFGQFTTTFNVDMTDAEGFDVATDEVFMSGNFAGWAQPGSDAAYKMEPVEAGSMVYTLTTTVDSGEVQYKYFRVIGGAASWDNGEWTGDPNRKIFVVADGSTLDNVWANMPYNVTFTVDMTNADPFDPTTDAIYIAGDLANGWAQPGSISAYMLTPVNETMVYGIDLLLYPGDYAYKYFRVIDGVPSWDNGEWTGDPNRMVTTDSTVTMVENVWGTTSIFDVKAEFAYSMYPNPANDFLTVANTADVSQVDIYDVTGKMVMTVNVASENVTLNVSDLNTGMYIINVTNERGVQTSKFVKN